MRENTLASNACGLKGSLVGEHTDGKSVSGKYARHLLVTRHHKDHEASKTRRPQSTFVAFVAFVAFVIFVIFVVFVAEWLAGLRDQHVPFEKRAGRADDRRFGDDRVAVVLCGGD